jgi:hypothetical protein
VAVAPHRKRFLLRISPELYAALEQWAADEFRSVNAQIEYLLTEAARSRGRLHERRPRDDPGRESLKGSDSHT